ncbi:MAG: arsenate reductase ArsC [Pseudomonadota bacterium]
MATRVLFLCTSNMARSIIAEGILKQDGGSDFDVHSAGAEPAGVISPFAIRVLNENGYGSDGLASKSWEPFAAAGQAPFDYVIALSSQARDAVFPEWKSGGELIYWPVTDPILVEGNMARMQANFEDAYETIKKYIDDFRATAA